LKARRLADLEPKLASFHLNHFLFLVPEPTSLTMVENTADVSLTYQRRLMWCPLCAGPQKLPKLPRWILHVRRLPGWLGELWNHGLQGHRRVCGQQWRL